MLRILVAALLIANLGFYAWSEGWLDNIVGVRSIGDREPERMARQLHPELVRVLPIGDAASAAAVSGAASAPSTGACLEAGPFSDAEVAAAQSAANGALPGAGLADVKTDKPGSWMVYMGRYADREALTKKEAELKRRKLPYEEVRNTAALAPGLSLGRFDERNAAVNALNDFAEQGIRTARVVEIAPASSSHLLRIENADAALATQAAALRLAALGKGFATCAKP
ncbi:MAG: SPOR domain-containing protein [Burkholderiales bacterium]